MKFMQVLKRESPLLVAREVLWRAHREWNKRRLLGRLEHVGPVKFRLVRYYNPDLQSLSERSRSIIVAFADEIQAGRYPFLGYGTAQLGTRPKWNLDFVSGAEWPHTTFENHQYIRNDGADVKVPFELSRLQFLPVLGKAHVLTGDESYRQTAKDLLSHWIQSNPVPVGVNWALAMEAALRAMSICLLLNLLSPFRPEEQPWLETVTRSLAHHLLFIEANNEFSHLITSNHYLSNAVGLYCLCLFLDGEDVPAKRKKYRQSIEAEMQKQVYDDGGDYEASTGYQVLVTQLFATALLLMRAEGRTPPAPEFVERLRAMFRFLHVVASSSGELPHVGDCDDGRNELLLDDLEQMLLLPVSQRNSLRVSNLLGLGEKLFGEGKGSSDDSAWYGLAGTGSAPYFKPHCGSGASRVACVFPKAGVGVLRRGSAELLFFTIPNGISGKGSHTHNDKLSFVLRVGSQEILCDSGTGCYTRDILTRNEFRGTVAHNTLRIDGVEQNRISPGPLGVFILGNEAAVSPIQKGADARGGFLRASHVGYRSLGVVHTRTIRVADSESAFVIEDELNGDGVHDFVLHFQLAPGRTAELTSSEKGILCCILGKPQVQLTVAGPANLKASIQPSLVGRTYGATIPAMRVRIWGRAAMPTSITTHASWVEATHQTNHHRRSVNVTNSREHLSEGISQA
jgi:Heparinase II/III-like protein/Heparinase II/III N-terminus